MEGARVMSKKVTVTIAGLVASLAVMVGTMQGCGSSGSGSNYQGLCDQACDRIGACSADAGSTFDVAGCKADCTAQSKLHCTNEAAISSKIQECLGMSDCTAAGLCAGTIPDCVMGGTGGTTGTAGGGGSTGTGGAGGTSGGGWTCEDQPSSGACVCLQDPSGSLTACPSSYTCCFTSNLGGTPNCSCTTVPQGVTCAQIVQAAAGAQVSHCPQ
jgi:hypothetical protein